MNILYEGLKLNNDIDLTVNIEQTDKEKGDNPGQR